MRIRLLSLILPALLALAACDGDTILPPTDPIHGSWSTPVELFLGRGNVDRAEHRYGFEPGGTYVASTLGWERGVLVYENQMTGEYRLEAGGLVTNVQAYRWRSGRTAPWQDEVVGGKGTFGPPIAYTVDHRRLIMHEGPSRGEHGEPIPAQDRIYSRR